MITRKRLVRWARLDKSRLRGFATVELPTGPEVVNCPVLTSHGTVWAAAFRVSRRSTGTVTRGAMRRASRSDHSAELAHPVAARGLSTRVVEFVRDTYPADLEGEAAE